MNLKRVILHVGTPKTGTTSLQHSLVDHQETLESKGIRYLRAFRRSLCHNHLTRLVKAKNNIEDIRSKISSEIYDLDPSIDTLLISSETAYGVGTTQKVLGVLPAELIEKTEVHFYFRRQDLFLEALAKQKYKNSKDGFDLLTFVTGRKHKGAYLAYIRKLNAAVPKIKIQCHPFKRSLLRDGDLVSDFWGQLDLPAPPRTNAEKSLSNKTPSVLLLHALKGFEFNSQRHRTLTLLRIAEQHPDLMASRDIMDSQTRNSFMERFRNHNRALSKICGHDLEHYFHDSVDWEHEYSQPNPEMGYEAQLKMAKAAILTTSRDVKSE